MGLSLGQAVRVLRNGAHSLGTTHVGAQLHLIPVTIFQMSFLMTLSCHNYNTLTILQRSCSQHALQGGAVRGRCGGVHRCRRPLARRCFSGSWDLRLVPPQSCPPPRPVLPEVFPPSPAEYKAIHDVFKIPTDKKIQSVDVFWGEVPPKLALLMMRDGGHNSGDLLKLYNNRSETTPGQRLQKTT